MKKFYGILLALFSAFVGNAQAPTAAQIRELIAGEIAGFGIKPEEVGRIENRMIVSGSDSIPIRVYYPNGEVRGILLNIHGGALVAGDLETHDNISRVLANRTDAVVVALDYRKPPEAPYPAGLENCIAALDWMRTHATDLGSTSGNIIVLGDSGGGLLAVSLLVRLQKAFVPKAVVLVNPAVDLRKTDNPLYQLVTGWYLNGHAATDSLASPALASRLGFFPSTLIITSEKDELKAQGQAYGQKLAAQGVRVETLDLKGKDHLGGVWAAAHPEANEAIQKVAGFIKKALGAGK